MKVSIIVPMYNSEDYIDECLSSLLEQTLQDIEVLCVDNCSTDTTVAKAKKYEARDSRFKVYVNDENRGQAYSVNRGIDLAQGEYIAECDADDWVHPEMYERMYKAAEGSDVVTCGWYDMYPDRIITRQKVGKRKMINPMAMLKGKELFSFVMNQPHIMSAIYKRDFILANNLRYRIGTQFEDTLLSLKIRTSAKRYVFLPDCLYYYRKSVPGSGTLTIKGSDGIFEQYEAMYRWNEENHLGLDKELGVAKYYSYLWGVSRLPTADDKREFWKRASAEFKNDVIDESYFFCESDLKHYKQIRAM